MATIANITWDFVPGSLSTLVEYKLSSSSVWISPSSPANPTTGNTYPIPISDGVFYDIRLTTNGSTCTPRSRTLQIIHISNNCCPSGYTLSDDETYCFQINDTTATGPTSPENSVESNNAAYSTCGSYIYSSFNPNGTGTSSQITLSNPFWKNGGTCADNNTTDGPLNRAGLWASSTTTNQDIGYGICIDVPDTKTYYMAVGCDNFAKINIDGTNIITQDPAALDIQYSVGGSCFKVWHIYPISLVGGITHYIELVGHNISGAAALGAEIYDNTASELISATSYAGLNLIFSTKDHIGEPIQLGTGGIGYTCPANYAVVFCDGPVFCRQILTTSTIPCGTTTTSTTTSTTSTTTTSTTTHSTTTTSTSTTTTTTHTTTTTSTSTTTTTSTTHTTTTTSSTTTTTTTGGPGIIDLFNSATSGAASISGVLVNGVTPTGMTFPVNAGGTTSGSSPASVSATVVISVISGFAGSISITSSAGLTQCQDFAATGDYTFNFVAVNNSAHVTININDIGIMC